MKAKKLRLRLRCGQRLCRRAKSVILLVRPHAKVLHMHMRPCRDRGGGGADDLAIFQDRFPRRHIAQGNLVACRDGLARGDAAGQAGARRHGAQRDEDVVRLMQADRKGLVGHVAVLHGVTSTLMR